MLQNFDHLLDSVICPDAEYSTGNTIILDFMDDFAFDEASAQWGSLERLTLITAHSGCNAVDEHGAWSYVPRTPQLESPDIFFRITSVVKDSTGLRLTLAAERVSIRDVVKSFSVSYEYTGARYWSNDEVHELARRQIQPPPQVASAEFNFDFSPSIDPHFSLFPPNQTIAPNVSSSLVR